MQHSKSMLRERGSAFVIRIRLATAACSWVLHATRFDRPNHRPSLRSKLPIHFVWLIVLPEFSLDVIRIHLNHFSGSFGLPFGARKRARYNRE